MKIKFWGVRGSLPSTIQPIHLKKRLQNIIHEFLKEGYSRIDQINTFLDAQPLSDLGGYGSATTCVQVSDRILQLEIFRTVNDELRPLLRLAMTTPS